MKQNMQQSKIDRLIPLPFKRRTIVRERFVTLLMFVEENGLKRSQWVPDSRLETNWKQLLQLYPSNSELDWLSYFLDIVKEPSKPLPEREKALAHLKSYYQETCYWAAKKFWENLYKKNFSTTAELIWEWEDLFDKATGIFECLEKAESDLKDFQPYKSIKRYVQTVVYYNLSNWRDKKIGRNTSIESISLDTYSAADSQEDKNWFLRQRQIEEAMALNEQLKEENYSSREMQERVLALVESELEQIKENRGIARKSKVGKTNLKLWDLLVLTYGLNLKQTGASLVLNANKKSINQATISRSLTTFILQLKLQLIKEFIPEIKEAFNEELNDEEKPIESVMEDWVKKKEKELYEVLKDRLQEKIFTLAIMSKERKLKQVGVTMPMEGFVREELNAWCDRSLDLCIRKEILPEKLDKKIEQLVRDFVKLLAVCDS